MNELIARQPKRKRQPTAEMMREQLRLAADEIIRLRTDMHEGFEILCGLHDDKLDLPQPWWRRIFRRAQ